MKILIRSSAATALVALLAAPAFAAPPEGTAGAESRPAQTQTADSNPGTAKKLAAPGRYCKGISKEKVEGQKGTPFSACVKAQARLRKGKADTPREACKGASKKHVKGEKGTPFSQCVKAAAQFLKDQKAQDEAQEQEQEATETETEATETGTQS